MNQSKLQQIFIDLDKNHLKLTLWFCAPEFKNFLKTLNLKKNQQMTKMHAKLTSMHCVKEAAKFEDVVYYKSKMTFYKIKVLILFTFWPTILISKQLVLTLTLYMLGNFGFLSSDDFFKLKVFKKILWGITTVCQTVWIQIGTDIMSVPIWIQTVCK